MSQDLYNGIFINISLHVARTWQRINGYKSLVGKPGREIPLGN
jgi:hypothetical protein